MNCFLSKALLVMVFVTAIENQVEQPFWATVDYEYLQWGKGKLSIKGLFCLVRA